MNETQRNIKQYKAALPGLRERIAASAMLLLVSLSMVVSASFAWYTISTAPEISMMSTTVAANGNLEIALVNPNGEEPEKSAIGDSSANLNQSLVDANITWGNLVNLSDVSYGISDISLRPARLTGYLMQQTPLYGATYSADGRVEKVSETYVYASYKDFGTEGFKFSANSDDVHYGVRAITSVKYSSESANNQVRVLLTDVQEKVGLVTSAYEDIILNKVVVSDCDNTKSMDALTALMTIFVSEKAASVVGGGAGDDYSSVAHYMYKLMEAFDKMLDDEGEALLAIVNLQAYMSGSPKGTKTYETVEDMLKAYNDKTMFTTYGLKEENLSSLGSYQTTRNKVKDSLYGKLVNGVRQGGLDRYKAETYYPNNNPPTVKWADFDDYVGSLVNVNTATLNGKEISKLGKSEILGMATTLMSGTSNVVIKDGAIKELEQRLGSILYQNREKALMKIVIDDSVDIVGGWTVKAYVYTDTTTQWLLDDQGKTGSMSYTGQGTDATAKDVYGMAVDLWLRTNTSNVNLTLEGNVITTQVQDTGLAKDGSEVPLYMLTYSDGMIRVGYSMIEDVETENGTVETTVWYNADNDSVLDTDDNLKEQNVVIEPKMVDVVVGYEGENRIWEDFQDQIDAGIIPDEDYTTQGAGSSYVFYANPTDQTRILDLLKSFAVVFVDQSGTKLATAKLDTEHSYAINGKVTVPLVVTEGITYTTIDEETQQEVEKIAIAAMEQNEPLWLTAIIYLDGQDLTNDQVLAAGEIEGRLNLQFGSSVPLTAANNEDLKYNSIDISAEATYGNLTSNSPENPIELTYDGKDKDIRVKVTIEGDEPSSVSAFFVRSISATQGTRMETVDFDPGSEDGTWVADFKLNRPGTYLLRSVIVDGVDYELERTVKQNGVETVIANYPAVEISGLGIGAVTCVEGSLMTADSYLDVDVAVQINADASLMPKQVRAIFEDENKEQVGAILTNENGTWRGTARFAASGQYTLTWVVMDGDYELLDASKQRMVDITLGLSAIVGCDNYSEVPKEYTDPVLNPDGTTTPGTSDFPLDMRLRIEDDSNNEQRNLTGVTLYYHSTSSKLDDYGMYAEMIWNESLKCYQAYMYLPSPGTFVFDRVEIARAGDTPNIIYRASSATRFTVSPKDPPKYAGTTTDDYQFVPNNVGKLTTATNDVDGAVMGVTLLNAQGADVWALMENTTTGKTVLVRNPNGEVRDPNGLYQKPVNVVTADGKTVSALEFLFDVPRNNDDYGKQDGVWKIKSLWLQSVNIKAQTAGGQDKEYPTTYADNVKLIRDPNLLELRKDFYVINLESENITAKVVETINARAYKIEDSAARSTAKSVVPYTGREFGKDAQGNITGTFMQEHTVANDVVFQLTDFSGAPIKLRAEGDDMNDGIANLVWEVTYNNDPKNYGGYEITSGAVDYRLTAQNAQAYELTMEADGVDFYGIKFDGTMKYSYAGTYSSTLQLVYNKSTQNPITVDLGTVVNLSGTVWSNKPTVTITGVSPATTESVPTRITWTVSSGWRKQHEYTYGENKTSVLSTDNNEVTVYAKAKKGSGTGDATFESPAITVTAAGVDSNSTIEFTIPAGSASERKVTITGNNSQTVTLGNVEKHYENRPVLITYTVYKFMGHGDQTISTVTIKRNGVTYKVVLEKPIKIHNPSSINQ